MKRWFIIAGAVLVVGVVVVFGLDWRFFMLTGRFTPRQIVETLNSPVAIVRINDAGLQTAEGSVILVPSVSNSTLSASVAKDVIEHGVEVQADGTIRALVRVHHWCGNDPVRYHLGRVDLSSLLMLLGEREGWLVTDDGIDPGLFRMATIPHQELKDILNLKSSAPGGAANGSQPIRSETNSTSSAVAPQTGLWPDKSAAGSRR